MVRPPNYLETVLRNYAAFAKIALLKHDLSFDQTATSLTEICQGGFSANRGDFVYPEKVRQELGNLLSETELANIRDKIPFERGNILYLPLTNNGVSNLGVVCLQRVDPEFLSLEPEDKGPLLSFICNLGGLLLAKTKDLEEVRRRADYDGLTGLLNKDALFQKYWPLFREKALLSKSPISVLALDVDNFKKYNDTFGHLQGDEALKTIGQVICASIHRSGDYAFRNGGEEFLVVLLGTPLAGGRKVAENILHRARKAEVETENVRKNGGDAPYSLGASKITLSIGISAFPEPSSHLDALLHDADSALYQAKNLGRDRIVIYSEAK